MMSLFPESNEIMFSLSALKEGQRVWFLGVESKVGRER